MAYRKKGMPVVQWPPGLRRFVGYETFSFKPGQSQANHSGLVTDLMVLANKTELNAFRSPKVRNI